MFTQKTSLFFLSPLRLNYPVLSYNSRTFRTKVIDIRVFSQDDPRDLILRDGALLYISSVMLI